MNAPIAKKPLVPKIVTTIALWVGALLIFLFALFVVAEQCEVARLGAIAACEGEKDLPKCMRTKGYLAAAPYYPDLTRRVLGSYARLAGNPLGASYKQIEPKKLEEGEEEEEKAAESSEKASAKGKAAK